ncbi:glycosyltransferase family 4 protein [Patescibacteria group bacterium]|nr:glycosyltransferase family 4 protein [Patescibacteria group bacterium]
MIVAIDGYEAMSPARVGVGRYAFEIITHIHELLRTGQEGRMTVRVYSPGSVPDGMPGQSSFWQYRIRGPRRLWTFWGLPLAIARDMPPARVIFSPTHYAPRFIRTPKVISVMDLSYLRYPELFRPKDLHQLVHWTAYSVRHAARILTISQFTRDAIIRAYHVPESRVTVTYPGMTQISTRPEGESKQEPNIFRTYGISRHYVLSVGTLQPRKNYVRLIEAFSGFLRANKQKFGSLELVIVGKKGWLYEDILSAPETYGVKDRVKFLDFVPDADLPELYRRALCFALPSLYEGFGLPVLEAMAYGCPVVVSNSSSLPEIAGKAGIYVDPADVTSITEGLLTGVRQRNLKQGTDRLVEGMKRAKQFTWEKAARKTLEVLEDVAGEG